MSIIAYLQNSSVITVSGLELAFSCLAMIIALYFWEVSGICVYIAIATVVANIEVLKGVHIFTLSSPIALGNVVYGTVSIALAITAELYGTKKARQCLTLGFFAMLIFPLFMLLTIGYKPLPLDSTDHSMLYLAENHTFMERLFAPSLGIVTASLLSFFISGRIEIFSLSILKRITKNNTPGNIIRIFIASNTAICSDLFMMNYMAWILFTGNDIGLDNLFYTYILHSYVFRIIVSSLTYPIIAICRLLRDNGTPTRELSG